MYWANCDILSYFLVFLAEISLNQDYMRTCWINVAFSLERYLDFNLFLSYNTVRQMKCDDYQGRKYIFMRNDDHTGDGGMQQHLWEKQTTDCAVSCPRLPPSASTSSLSLFKMFYQNLVFWYFMISLSVFEILIKLWEIGSSWFTFTFQPIAPSVCLKYLIF